MAFPVTVILYLTMLGGRRGRVFGREGVLWRFLNTLALPVSPPDWEIIEDVPDGLAAYPREAWRGYAGIMSGDVVGHGEGDPVWVDPGGSACFGLQSAQGRVDGEEREQLLTD